MQRHGSQADHPASAGKPLSKCGKCKRFMRLISARPMRLYCPTCEEVLGLPQGGAIKLYQGLACPLDGYEMVSCLEPCTIAHGTGVHLGPSQCHAFCSGSCLACA